MKLCPECNHSPLPFALVAMIAAIIGVMTWLTLGLSTEDPLTRIGGAVAVFLAVGGTLLHYVLSCIQRHCKHQQQYGRTSSAASRS